MNVTGRFVVQDLEFVPLTGELICEVEEWFDDGATLRFLGGRDWIWRELWLLISQPGAVVGDVRVAGRHAWLVRDADERFVGFIGVEVYDDDTAALSMVVAPEVRGLGVGRRVLGSLDELPELAGVERLVGGVEPANHAARQVLVAAGFKVSHKPDDEGMLDVERVRSR